MKILVAGGAGFIGSHFCELALKNNHELIIIDSLITSNIKNIENIINDKRVTFIKQNICDPIKIDEKVDKIINLASPASPIDFDKLALEIIATNSNGHKNLLDFALKKGASILLCSTSEVYGDPLVHPQKEDYFGNVNCIGPRSPYDEGKRFSETLTYTYHRKYSLDVRVARIFNTYGPRMRISDGRVIPNFIVQALKNEPLTIYGEGKQTRSFCYVSDMIDGLYRLLFGNEIYPVNIGNPVEKEIIDVARLINNFVGNSSENFEFLPLPENDPKIRCPNISRAKDLLNWQPKVFLEEGIKTTVDYFKKIL